MTYNSPTDLRLRRRCEGRLIGLRVNRYSWWVHARDLADYLFPRRYKWLITPNQQSRGAQINQHILDSTGTLAARNCAAGMMTGATNPTKIWFKLKIGRIDSTQTSPVSLWLAECERLMMLVFQQSNFYMAMATWYFDLVIFGTAALLIYEDYDEVIRCFNPCFGEYYVDNDGQYRPTIFYREFTLNVAQVVDRFGIDNVSDNIKQLYETTDAANLARELIIAHAVEPNTEPEKFGIPSHFKFRECYWEWGGSSSPQGGGLGGQGLLLAKGFYEQFAVVTRWDLVANDAYGRSPGMDALPDVKQLQQETRRKAQGLDKTVNPPMVADIQLKNQPASLLPGGVTYISGMMATGNDGFKSVYGNWKPDIPAVTEDIKEVQERVKQIFFNDLFRTVSQFETRSNVTAYEISERRAESLIMLGPVFERLQNEGLAVIIDRVFAIMSRAGILPPAPQEIAGAGIDIEYVSLLSTAQAAAASSGIERLLGLAGNLAGVDPAIMDNIDLDYALDKMSSLLNNDPKMIRSPEQLAQIRMQRQQAQQQAQQAEMAEKLAAGAKTLSETEVGGGRNALQQMTGA